MCRIASARNLAGTPIGGSVPISIAATADPSIRCNGICIQHFADAFIEAGKFFCKLFRIRTVIIEAFVVNGIFKAGMWWAFFLVGLVVVLILFVLFKARKK